jgi:hypothetical protein
MTPILSENKHNKNELKVEQNAFYFFVHQSASYGRRQCLQQVIGYVVKRNTLQ